MARRLRRGLVPLLAALALPAAAPAPERLVTRDGTVIETRGPWERRGGLVLFRDLDGRLASLKESEVDFGASAELALDPALRRLQGFVRALGIEIADEATLRWTVATLTEIARREAAPAAPAAPILVLTDSDVRHLRPKEAEPAEPELGGARPRPAGAAAEPGAPALEVAAWERGFDAEHNGVRISGRVRNAGTDPVAGAAVTALLYAPGGALVGTGKSGPQPGVLSPGDEAEFEIVLPGISDFAEARFHVHGAVLHRTGGAGAVVD